MLVIAGAEGAWGLGVLGEELVVDEEADFDWKSQESGCASRGCSAGADHHGKLYVFV